jgi:hypothetical protein
MVDTANRRKPGFLPLEGPASGRVTRDDLGNAVWQWDGKREELNGSFHHLGLAIEGHEPEAEIKVAKKSRAKNGYDPYQRPKSPNPTVEKPKPSKRDLRALSKHIALQRLVKQNKNKGGDEDEDEEL